MISIYLAGKMQGLSYEEMTGWRIRAKKLLNQHDLMVFDPTVNDPPDSRSIVTTNKLKIVNSRVVLAEMNHKNISIGTVGEIVFAAELGIPVVVWGTIPWILNHPWISEHVVAKFRNVDTAVNYIITVLLPSFIPDWGDNLDQYRH